MTHSRGQVVGTSTDPENEKAHLALHPPSAKPLDSTGHVRSVRSRSGDKPGEPLARHFSAVAVRLFSVDSFLKLTADYVVLILASGDTFPSPPFRFRQGIFLYLQGWLRTSSARILPRNTPSPLRFEADHVTSHTFRTAGILASVWA